MSKRVFIPGLSVFCALAMISSISATAMAQQVPVRVIQGSDGTMYVLQGGNSWTLVPDQASDSDVAALNPGGEIDGTLPNELFVVQAPAAPPAAAPAPPAAAPAPPAAAPAPPAAAPITGTADLTGKAGNEVATATLIAPGATITSVVDPSTKPHDVFAIALSAGTTYQVLFTGIKTSAGYNNFNILNPDTSQAKGCLFVAATGDGQPCTFSPAASGTYYIRIDQGAAGQKYTFTMRQM